MSNSISYTHYIQVNANTKFLEPKCRLLFRTYQACIRLKQFC